MLVSEMFINRCIHLIENGEPDTASETKIKSNTCFNTEAMPAKSVQTLRFRCYLASRFCE